MFLCGSYCAKGSVNTKKTFVLLYFFRVFFVCRKMEDVNLDEYDEVDMVLDMVNQTTRYQNLSAEERQRRDALVARYFDEVADDEEPEPFPADDDEDNEYLPENDVASHQTLKVMQSWRLISMKAMTMRI